MHILTQSFTPVIAECDFHTHETHQRVQPAWHHIVRTDILFTSGSVLPQSLVITSHDHMEHRIGGGCRTRPPRRGMIFAYKCLSLQSIVS